MTTSTTTLNPVALREAAGLTREDAARALGVSTRTLYSHESAGTAPRAPTIRKMAALYGIPEGMIGVLTRFWEKQA